MRIEDALLIKTVEELIAVFKDLMVALEENNKSNERLIATVGPVGDALTKVIEKVKE